MTRAGWIGDDEQRCDKKGRCYDRSDRLVSAVHASTGHGLRLPPSNVP